MAKLLLFGLDELFAAFVFDEINWMAARWILSRGDVSCRRRHELGFEEWFAQKE
ncbi:MAG: hypothetical protein WCA38_14595 [Candidatus Acidiferrales bacterium]